MESLDLPVQPPSSWRSARVDWVMSEVRESIEPAEHFDGHVFHYSIPNIQTTGDGQLEPASEIGSAKLRITRPTLLVSKLNPRKGVVLEARVRRDVPTVCSSEFVCLLARDCDLRFSSYLFQSEAVRQHLSGQVKSATRSHQRIQASDITKLWLYWPPPTTQRAIAAFLDREIAKIDALIERKRRLLDLLDEKRTALITRAVTRGLDPDVPMKDSGVEWLGEIPAHWDAVKLGRLLRQSPSYGVLKPERYQGADSVPLLRISDLDEGIADLEAAIRISPDQSEEYKRTIVREGDVVVSVVGTIGAVFVVPGRQAGANLSRALARVAPDPRLLPDYLKTFVESRCFARYVDLVSQGTAQRVLNMADLANLYLALPPLEEQARIISSVENSIQRLGSLRERIRRATSLLQEYRAALISAAVTGQIDIPGAAA